MGSSQQFSLRWNNYLSHITGAFDSLRSDEDLVDVTLSCEGKRIRAHKMLLSACSTYFRDLFKENPCQHPVIIFRNVKFEDLVALIDFMYQGEVNVVQEQLASFLTTAELLAVQGLSEGSGKDTNSESREDDAPDSPSLPPEPEVQMTSSSQQSVCGPSTSNVASPVSFYSSVDQRSESPPLSKRRKWSSSSSGTSKNNSANGSAVKDSEKESECERKRSSTQTSGVSNTEPLDIMPVVPNLKVEMPDYLEHDPEASSCSYSDSNPGIACIGGAQNSSRDCIPSTVHGLPSGSSTSEGKLEPPDMFSANSRDASLPASDNMPGSDLGQLLVKPGPSSESQSQDSLQGFSLWSHLNAGRPAARKGKGTSTAEQALGSKRKFVCVVCGAAYAHAKSLSSHLRYHAGETECHLCHKVLSRRTHVTRHLRVKHGIKLPPPAALRTRKDQ